jgi:iron complex outermembrane receptor protein
MLQKSDSMGSSRPCLRPLLSAVVLASALAPASFAYGQESDGLRLEEIVVTATRRSVSLQDVPLAVSALSADDIESRGLTEFSDYLNSMPSVQLIDLAPGRNQIRIRGISTSEYATPPTVAVYLGEVPMTVTGQVLNGNPNPRLVDMERVEVLKGPQGTLFGANALGGAVRLIPNSPNLQEIEGSVSASASSVAHSDDTGLSATGALNLPIVTDKAALRVAAYTYTTPGYIDNVVPAADAFDIGALFGVPDVFVVPPVEGRVVEDINEEVTNGVRASLLVEASDRLSLTFSHSWQDSTLDGEPLTDPNIGTYEHSRVISDEKLSDEFNLSNLLIDYEFDGASLISSTGFMDRTTVNNRDITAAGSSLIGAFFGLPGIRYPWRLADQEDYELFVQEVRLNSTGEGALQWLIGAFYSDLSRNMVQVGTDESGAPFFANPFVGIAVDDTLVDIRSDFSEEQVAVFGELTYALSDRVTVGAGLRWFDSTVEFNQFSDGPLVTFGAVPAIETAGRESSDDVNPHLQLQFFASENHNIYARAAKGFRSPVVNALADNALCAPELAALGNLSQNLTEPDTVWNYEIGSKSTLADGRVQLNVAAYVADWRDIQVPIQLECGFFLSANAGDAESKGAELELSAAITDGLRVNFSASFTDAKFKDTISNSLGLAIISAGQRTPGTPEWNVYAGLEYGHQLTDALSGSIGFDFNYISDYPGLVEVTTPGESITSVGDYSTVNGHYVLTLNESTDFELFAKNVFDERGVTAETSPTNLFGFQRYLIRPRTIGVQVRHRF